jgi:hypothetical protein
VQCDIRVESSPSREPLVAKWHQVLLGIALAILPLLPIWKRATSSGGMSRSGALIEVGLFSLLFLVTVQVLAHFRSWLLPRAFAYFWVFLLVSIVQIWHSSVGLLAATDVLRLYLEPIIIFFSVFGLSTTAQRDRVARVIAYSGVFLGLLALIQVVYPDWIFWFHVHTGADPGWLRTKSDFTVGSPYNRAISLLDDPNVAGQVFVAGWCAQVYLTIRKRTWHWPLASMVSMAAIAASGSRSGFLALSAGLFGLTFYAFRAQQSHTKRLLILFLSLIIVMIPISMTVSSLRTIVLSRVQMFNTGVMSNDLRLQNWRLVLNDTFSSASSTLLGNGFTPGDIRTSQISENSYISAFRDFGLLGLMSLGAMIACFLTPVVRRLGSFVIVFFAAYLVANMFGDYMKIPMISCWYAGLIGITYQQSPQMGENRREDPDVGRARSVGGSRTNGGTL